MTTKNTTVLDARAVERTLKRMSVEIVDGRNPAHGVSADIP